jgi:sugar phosphate isomerase/epimerase
MKISIRAGLQARRGSDLHPLKWAFEQGKELGFDGLELCMRADRNGFVTMMRPEWRSGIADLAKEYGMPIFSLSGDWAWSYAVFNPTYKEWAQGVKFLAKDAALLKDVAAAGEQYGVRFGFEANIWASTTGYGAMDSLTKMVDEVGSEYFGIYLHNAYPRGGLPLHEEIEKAGDRLVQAMHSSDLVDGRIQIDWPKTLKAMETYFPDGAYTFEVPWDTAEANIKALKAAIA